MEYGNIKTSTHQLKHKNLKTVTQFLVSVSVLFLIYYSHYSFLCYFTLHPLKFYLSAIQLHFLDKTWIFLICNGILVAVLTNTSAFVSSPSIGFDLNDEWFPEKEVILVKPTEHIGNAAVSQVEETLEEVEEEESPDDQVQCFEEEQGDKSRLIEEINHEEFSKLEDWEEDLEAAGFLLAEEEEEELEEHGMEKLSSEELNKKFEDFIRKMKEELRIEAQQQLVVVVK